MIFWQLFISFLKVGLLGFGGGLAIVRLINDSIQPFLNMRLVAMVRTEGPFSKLAGAASLFVMLPRAVESAVFSLGVFESISITRPLKASWADIPLFHLPPGSPSFI